MTTSFEKIDPGHLAKECRQLKSKLEKAKAEYDQLDEDTGIIIGRLENDRAQVTHRAEQAERRLRRERDDLTALVAREQEWRREAERERDEARKENARGYMDALRGVRAEWREMMRAEQERAEALRAEVEAKGAEVERLRGLLAECEEWLPHGPDEDPPSYPQETRWALTARRNARMCIALAKRVRAALDEEGE